MANITLDHKKDGWHWAAPDGTKGGPFETKSEAVGDGYSYQLTVENPPKAAKKP